MKNVFVFILAVLLTSLSACHPEKSTLFNVQYDEPFTIEKNNQYQFPDGNFFVVDGLKNAFCPCNADCVWAGEMIVFYHGKVDGETYSDSRVGSDPVLTDSLIMSKNYYAVFSNIKPASPCKTITSAEIVVKKK